MQSIIAISGISGAGKSTIGKLLADRINAVFIDQDWFFKSDIENVILSNGSSVKNYDSDQSIDIEKFNTAISEHKKNNHTIIISGFALRDYFFCEENKPNVHFHIIIPTLLSFTSRLTTKPFSEKRKIDEAFLFYEYVYPYYEETITKSNVDYIIIGTISLADTSRKDIEDRISEIRSEIISNESFKGNIEDIISEIRSEVQSKNLSDSLIRKNAEEIISEILSKI